MLDRSAESMPQNMSCFRRHTSRVEAKESVYAFWSCGGQEGLSRVRDLGPAGLFIETPVEENLGALVTLHFLADEGQIRASAEVRRTRPGQGVGLKFIAINGQDCPHLAASIRRLAISRRVCRPRAGV
jgi:PilZ domain